MQSNRQILTIIFIIYHCSIQIIGRSGGKSAVASAAYRSGEKLYDERAGLVHDFTKKRGVVFTEVALPAHAPPEYSDRNILWNAVEKAEKNSNAQLAREIEVALKSLCFSSMVDLADALAYTSLKETTENTMAFLV